MMMKIIINNDDQSFQVVDISYMSSIVWQTEYKHASDLQANDTKWLINAEPNTVTKTA